MANLEHWRFSDFQADPRWRQIAVLLALLIGVVAFGTIGYRVLLGWSWLDSIYMTIITITTVGFGEVQRLDPGGQIFTII